MNFNEEYKRKIENTDKYIETYFDGLDGVEKELIEAMKYSVLNGGKRLRSILCTEICAENGGDPADALPYAAAIEFIHAYSLVHDDLPCMDNADMRRGMPSCHKKFGQAQAVLTGDGLLNLAFELMSARCIDGGQKEVRAMNTVAHCSGVFGMVGGQSIDLKLPLSSHITEEELTRLIERKTMALIRASIISGALIADCGKEKIARLEEYAYHLGLAFQIRDDFEDEAEDAADKNNCPNFINVLGRDEAANRLKYHADSARKIIETYGEDSFLCRFHDYLFGDYTA